MTDERNHEDGSLQRVLLPHHRQHLRASGLKDATIHGRYYSCDDATGREILGWSKSHPGNAAGLVVPYPNVKGYAKVRPDQPRSVGGRSPEPEPHHDYRSAEERYEAEDVGKPKVIKYEAPLGQPLHPYIPLDLCPDIADPEEPLNVGEGEKKADLLCQQGLPAIGLPGVNGAHDAAARREAQDWGGEEWLLHPELRRYVLPKREVRLLFDTPDMVENRNVVRAAVQTARLFADVGAIPYIGYVPPVRGASKTGVDDYFVEQMKRAATSGCPTYDPLASVIHDARPVAPHELLEWLQEQRDESGWERTRVATELRRAAVWTRVWHERDDRLFKAWMRSASKSLYVNVEEIERMVAHLPTLRRASNSAWDGFNDARVLEHCVPFLNEHYRLMADAAGIERVFLVNERNEAAFQQSDSNMRKALHDHLKARFGEVPPDGLLKTSITLWKKETLRIKEEPEPFCFAGDDRLCFKRFDWQPTEGEFAAWKEFLSRLSDPVAFMAYVWSCFEKASKSRQYLWLRGDGQDGKSTIIRILVGLFGAAAASINNTHVQNGRQFFFSSLYGKRVCAYPDCKNAKFGMTELVRNLTSGDPVPVEFKGETPFTIVMRMKLLIASNEKPEFTGQTADTSRIIYIEVAASEKKDDPGWEDRLKEELPAFLAECRGTYERVCAHHGNIPLSEVSRRLLEAAATEFEQEFHDVFDSLFEEAPGHREVASRVLEALRSKCLSNEKVRDFKRWAERVHGVSYDPQKGARYYKGLRFRSVR